MPALFASIVTQRITSGTIPMPEMSSVGGISIVRPSAVVNWLFSESLPEMKGARYAIAPS